MRFPVDANKEAGLEVNVEKLYIRESLPEYKTKS
jgi:hypothetical protein